MKDLRALQAFAVNHPFLGQPKPDGTAGAYRVPAGRSGEFLMVIASTSNSDGWDHVSVSLPHRCPTWEEMEAVKRLFFKEDEVAMQLHVPPKDHISVHPYCLHLWRPTALSIPRPPAWMVA